MSSIHLLRILCLSLPISCIGCKNQQHEAEATKRTSPEISPVAPPEEITEDPGDLYYQAYLLTREASNTQERDQALQKLQESLDRFQAIKTKFPHWKPQMVEGRIELTTKQIAKLKQTE
jgi:hypothetical protein